jgi:hypothetical protein
MLWIYVSIEQSDSLEYEYMEETQDWNYDSSHIDVLFQKQLRASIQKGCISSHIFISLTVTSNEKKWSSCWWNSARSSIRNNNIKMQYLLQQYSPLFFLRDKNCFPMDLKTKQPLFELFYRITNFNYV